MPVAPAPFEPLLSNTAALSVSSVTASAAITLPSEGGVAATPGARTCRVFNATAVTVFIQFGDSTVVATTAKMPVPTGAVEVFSIGGATYIAGITASGTGTVYATPGYGA